MATTTRSCWRPCKQLERMPHVMLGGLAHEQAYRLASRLAALLPGDLSRAFFFGIRLWWR